MKKVKRISILLMSIFIGISLFTACSGAANGGGGGSGANSGKGQNQGSNKGTNTSYDDPDGDIIITFNSNTSSNPVTVTQKIKSNSVITLRPNNFTNEDHIFAGWSLSSTDSQSHVKYLDKSQAKFQNSITLYAVWNVRNEGQNFNINFYMNYEGASEQPYVFTGYRSPSLGLIYLPQCPVIREGYHFIGWSKNKNQICPSYDKDKNYDLFMFDTDLYAIWAQDGKIPVFYLNDRDEETATVTRVDYDTDSQGKYQLSLPDCTYTKAGKVFTYWDIKTYYYYPKNTCECTDYVKAVATWCNTSDAVKVTLHRNHDNNDTETVVYNVNKTYSTVLKNIFTKDNYVFLYWNTKANGSGDTKRTTDAYWYSSDTDLYAIWKESDPKKITYHSNFGTDETYEEYQEADIYFFTKDKDLFTREGYELLYWSKAPDKLENYSWTNNQIKVTEDTDFYAFWGKEGCIATYHYNDGTNRTETQTYVSNKMTTKLDSLSRTNYDWYGWAVEGVDTITTQTKASKPSSFFTTDQESINLYAWWMPCHTVRVYSNYEGAEKEYYTNIDAWDSFGDNITDWRVYIHFTRDGYTIKGLSKTSDGSIVDSISFNDGSEDYFKGPISDIPDYDKGPQTVEYYIIWEADN